LNVKSKINILNENDDTTIQIDVYSKKDRTGNVNDKNDQSQSINSLDKHQKDKNEQSLRSVQLLQDSSHKQVHYNESSQLQLQSNALLIPKEEHSLQRLVPAELDLQHQGSQLHV